MVMNVENKVRGIVAQVIKLPLRNVQRESGLEELGVSALDKVEIALKIEQTLQVPMQDEVISALPQIGQIIKYVENIERYRPMTAYKTRTSTR